jgi:hypothetical protein
MYTVMYIDMHTNALVVWARLGSPAQVTTTRRLHLNIHEVGGKKDHLRYEYCI